MNKFLELINKHIAYCDNRLQKTKQSLKSPNDQSEIDALSFIQIHEIGLKESLENLRDKYLRTEAQMELLKELRDEYQPMENKDE